MEYSLRTTALVCSVLYLSPLNAVQLGQMSVTDPIMGSKTIVYEKKNGYAVVEGDILLGKLENLNNQSAIVTPKIGGSRWPHGILAYEINENLPFPNKLAVYQAIDHWQKNSKIEFIELTSQNRSSYHDYVSFTAIEGTTCASFVGRHGGKQVIELSPRCTTMNIVHEIGHSLGLWHEQSRADRNYYIRILWENIDDEYKYNFDQHLSDGKDFGEYDYQSIMHYGPYAFSKNGQRTLISLVDGVEIGQRDHLSQKDVAAINAMYSE